MYWNQFLEVFKKVALLFPLYYVEYEWNEYFNGEWHRYTQAGVLNLYAVEHVKQSAEFNRESDKQFLPNVRIIHISLTHGSRQSWVGLLHPYKGD